MIMQTTSGFRYAEFGNLNALRSYPFAEDASLVDSGGRRLPDDVFSDACVWPVVRPGDPVRVTLDRVDFSDGSAALSGKYSVASGAIELRDGRGRKAGVLSCGPGWGREAASGRVAEFPGGAALAPSACVVVAFGGVEDLSGEPGTGGSNSAWRTSRRDIALEGDGTIAPAVEDGPGGPSLHFDAYPPAAAPSEAGETQEAQETPSLVVRQVVFAAYGRAPFAISAAEPHAGPVDSNGLLLAGSGLDREDVCWQAHRGDSAAVVADACAEDSSEPCPGRWDLRPFLSETVEVCPDEHGSVALVADDLLDQRNPFRVSPVSGSPVADPPRIDPSMSPAEMSAEASRLLGLPRTAGNGILIEMAGLGNGG